MQIAQPEEPSQNLTEELLAALKEIEPFFDCYLCIVQRGTIAIGVREITWYLGEQQVIKWVPALDIFEYMEFTDPLNPFFDELRAEVFSTLREGVIGGVSEVLSINHFKARRDAITDITLRWMKGGKQKKRIYSHFV